MTFTDPTGREWVHLLEVEMTQARVKVAPYFLDYLTLDDIDAEGRRPIVETAEFVTNRRVRVFWNHPFTLEEITAVCQIALPEQVDPNGQLYCNNYEPDCIGSVWYDGTLIKWLTTDD